MTTLLNALQSALGDRYGVERELGRGGMATVYLAEDRRHSRQVAIKVLEATARASSSDADRFFREIRISANLVHPGIVPLFDSGECNGTLYYVMPFIASETLGAALERQGRVDVDVALRMIS